MTRTDAHPTPSGRRRVRTTAAASPASIPANLAAAGVLAVVLATAAPAAAEADVGSEPTPAPAPAQAAPAADTASAPDAAALSERIAALESALKQARQAQAEAEAQVAELESTLAQKDERRQSTAMEHTAQLSAAELRAREHKQRLMEAEARIRELEDRLAERDARVAALEQAAAAREALSQRLETLRARLPAPEGGSLTADEAQQRAEADARRLTELVEDARGIDNPRLWGEVRSAENALHHSQFLLARADDARTVYRVRPGDSLRQISRRFYGTGERWTELFEANRHVMQGPDQLLPGLTLVVP
ncbi:MAG: LysM peptidoglycan-binding domain-containing protein [Gammaproteobacteria bacterium]|nr:LysM peptidoglycan-binding domain-containing protein [Gammaproteobacteria bacterium]